MADLEFSQVATSVFSHITATPSDLINQRNAARLVQDNQAAKLAGKSTSSRVNYKPIVIVGPSGVGKGTLIGKLTEEFKDRFGFSVSYTTRAPRPGEENGVHYNFVTQEKFNEMIEEDGFVEHCGVHGKMYGTAKKEIARIQGENKIPLLDIDVQGALKFHKAFPESNFVAVLPDKVATLRQRLVGRGTETQETLAIRAKNATSEVVTLWERTDIFNFRVINDDLKVAIRVMSLLCLGLYPEELTGKSSADLIA